MARAAMGSEPTKAARLVFSQISATQGEPIPPMSECVKSATGSLPEQPAPDHRHHQSWAGDLMGLVPLAATQMVRPPYPCWG